MQISHFDVPPYIQENIMYVQNIQVFITSYSGKNKCFLDLKKKHKQSIPSWRKEEKKEKKKP
jgi:hypothetical protein